MWSSAIACVTQYACASFNVKGHIVIKPTLLPLWINCIFKFVPVIRTGMVPHYFTIKHCNVIMLICMAFMIAKQLISTFWATLKPSRGNKVFTIIHGAFSLRYWAGVNQQPTWYQCWLVIDFFNIRGARLLKIQIFTYTQGIK